MKLEKICLRKASKLILIFIVLSFLSLGIQKNQPKKIVKCKVNYLEIENSINMDSSIDIMFSVGFNKQADIVVKLNNQIVSKCKGCKTNESIGFVQEVKSKEAYYHFYLDYSKIKTGNILEFTYNNEVTKYKIERNIFKYSALYIYRIDKKNWTLSFQPHRTGNIE